MIDRCAWRCIGTTVSHHRLLARPTTWHLRQSPLFTHAHLAMSSLTLSGLFRVAQPPSSDPLFPIEPIYQAVLLSRTGRSSMMGTTVIFRLSRQGGSEKRTNRRLDHLSGKSHLKEIAT